MQSLHPGNSSYQVNAPGAPNSKHHCPACRVSWGSDLLRQICLPSGCPANLKKDRVCLIEALFRDGGFSSKGVPHNNRTFSCHACVKCLIRKCPHGTLICLPCIRCASLALYQQWRRQRQQNTLSGEPNKAILAHRPTSQALPSSSFFMPRWRQMRPLTNAHTLKMKKAITGQDLRCH